MSEGRRTRVISAIHRLARAPVAAAVAATGITMRSALERGMPGGLGLSTEPIPRPRIAPKIVIPVRTRSTFSAGRSLPETDKPGIKAIIRMQITVRIRFIVSSS